VRGGRESGGRERDFVLAMVLVLWGSVCGVRERERECVCVCERESARERGGERERGREGVRERESVPLIALHVSGVLKGGTARERERERETATHCNTLQHTVSLYM